MNIDVRISTNIDKDGTLSFKEIQLVEIQENEDKGTISETYIAIDSNNTEELISKLKKLVAKLEKAAGIVKEERQLENIINTIIEPNMYQEEDEPDRPFDSVPVWNCQDHNLPCLGCVGCGGIPGSIANDIRKGLIARAVNNYIEMFGGSKIYADNKIKKWRKELPFQNGTHPGGILSEN